ncbi:MAG: DNA repair protein RecN, partial [Acidimicrobiales bacterium]
SEDERLEAEEAVLADALAHRQAAEVALAALTDDGAGGDALAGAIAAIASRSPFAAHEERLRSVAAELTDVAAELRASGESIEEDPERLAELQSRRRLLRELCRKYGETLQDVLAFADETRRRLADLEEHDERAATLERERVLAVKREEAAAAVVAEARRQAAPRLAAAVEAHLTALAMPRAKLTIDVGEDPGDDVSFLLAANPGGPLLPLIKVASGGELARAMLGLRLALLSAGHDGAGPSTLVFDEVDAGIGGAAAVTVGRSLAALAVDGKQVLVVTHLPQVAAFAHSQIAVETHELDGAAVARAAAVDGEARVVELSRMLSGSPGSDTARTHAAELLETAQTQRRRGRARDQRR